MNTALLLLEIQNDYFPNGRIPLEKSIEATGKAEQLLRAFRDKKFPIIHVQHISTNPDAAYMLPCTRGAEFHPSVQPLKNEAVIKKHSPNSFKDTQLLNYLIKNKINQLVICGMMTHSTIDATVRAANDLGFNCIVMHDACTSRQLEFNFATIPAQNVHHAFLAALQLNDAAVMSTEDYLRKMGVQSAAEAIA
jgi:nicotinamidase-related amidase